MTGAPQLVIHYVPPGRQGRTYCGVEHRSGSPPATASEVGAVDCLSCLRAHASMWGRPAADRIVEVRRARARTAELLGLA